MIMDDVSPAFLHQSNGRMKSLSCRRMLLFIGVLVLIQFSVLPGKAGALLPPVQNGSLLEVTNGNVRLEYNLSTGRANFYWQNSIKISGFYAGVELASYITDTIYTNHAWTVVSNEVVVTSTTSNLPAMIQSFIFDQNDSFLTSVSMSASTNL